MKSTRSKSLSRNTYVAIALLGGAVVLAIPKILQFVDTEATQFSPTERAAILKYWNAPGRYHVSLRPDPEGNGPFVVRITPAGSKWFAAYNRYTKKNAASLAVALDGVTLAQQWESWVNAKLAFDQAVATQQTNDNNEFWKAMLWGTTLKLPPTPQLPPQPGPIPTDLQQAVGNAPPFAAFVAPSQYTVDFGNGATFTYTDNVPISNPRYPSYRFTQGVSHSGTPLSKLGHTAVDRIFATSELTPFESHVMRAVCRLEGGFDAVNTYDTGFVSIGFLQFAALRNGTGSLAALLRSEKKADPLDFQKDFRRYGLDVNDQGALVALDLTTGDELTGSATVQKIIDDKRLTAVFQRAGAHSDAFRAAQIRVAKASYYPANFPITVKIGNQTLTGQVRDVIHSEAGMAILTDRKVNTGNLKPLNDVLARIMKQHQLTKLTDLTPYEREIGLAMKWRHDFFLDATLTQP